jgi:DNA-binding MarR family transcriptional regulator
MVPIRAGFATPARLFRELARVHVRAQRAEVAKHIGSETTCTILTELGRAKSLSMGELATRLRLDKGWVSRAIDRLEADGAVARGANPDDARGVVLSLTPVGRRQHRRLERLLDSQIERVFARVRAADRPRVAAAVALLFDAYRAEVSDARAPLGATA